MPFNITTGSQSFSSGSSVPAVQNWNFNPPNIAVSSAINAANNLPSPQDVSIRIKDFFASPFASTHTGFKMRVRLQVDPDAPAMVSIASSTHTLTGDIDLTASSSLDMLITATFAVMSVLLEGTYRAYINITVLATNTATSLEEEIDLRGIEIKLDRVGTTLNEVTPRGINISYLIGTGMIGTAAFDILPALRNGLENWRLLHLNDTAITIASTSTLPNPFGAGDFILGSGAQTGSIALTNIWENKPVGLNNTFIEVFFAQWAINLGISLNVHVFNSVGASVSPNQLSFMTFQPDNPVSQQLDIYATGAFTITAPSWLQLSATSGTGAAIIDVQPIDVANFTAGEFTGNIVVTTGGQSFTVPVYFQVNDDLKTNLKTAQPNFTLDPNFIQIDGFDNNFYLQIKTTGNTYDLQGNAFPFSDTVRVPYVNATARYEVGRLIHQAMQSVNVESMGLSNLENAVSFRDYPRNALVDFDIQVVDSRTNVPLLSRPLLGVKFVPGHKPTTSLNSVGVLSYIERVSRITVEGYHVFNVFNFNAGSVRLLKNEVEIDSFFFAGSEKAFKRIFIKGSDFQPGDRVAIEVNYFNATGVQQSIKEYVIIYPAKEYSRTLAFLTYYNTIEFIECTGAVQASSPYTSRANNTVKNNVDIVEIVDTLRSDSLVINTGWIGEDQRLTVDLLKRCNKAWLISDSGVLELAARPEVFEHSDTERFLHNYECQFNINRKNDAQIHLF